MYSNKEKYSNRTKSDYDSLRQIREEVRFWCVDDNWVLDFLIYWGQKILERLADFIEKYDIEESDFVYSAKSYNFVKKDDNAE